MYHTRATPFPAIVTRESALKINRQLRLSAIACWFVATFLILLPRLSPLANVVDRVAYGILGLMAAAVLIIVGIVLFLVSTS